MKKILKNTDNKFKPVTLGFTLIELLAVIVILAIIALIGTPIVLDIIEKSKDSTQLNSANHYMDAIEYAMANILLNNEKITDAKYKILSNGNVCLEIINDETCNNELVIDMKSEKPSDGEITIANGKIEDVYLEYGNSKIIKDENGVLVYAPPTCILAENGDVDNSGTITKGDKYLCKVDPHSDEYTFYVLGINNDGTTNLILDQNINSDGSIGVNGVSVSKAINGVYDLVAWQTSGVNADGPVTIMEFLYNATKNWTNVPALNYIYNDKEFQGGQYGFTTFSSIDGILTITSATDPVVTTIIGTKTAPLRARIPIYSSDATKTEVVDKTDSSEYLYYNIDLINKTLPNGYWTLSSRTIYSNRAWLIHNSSRVRSSSVSSGGSMYGVRPVITLKI